MKQYATDTRPGGDARMYNRDLMHRDYPTDVESPLRTCPNCGKRLDERKCRLFCPDPICGYYVSCSDYY